MKRKKEIKKKSEEQRAKGRGQRAESEEQRAESKEQRAEQGAEGKEPASRQLSRPTGSSGRAAASKISTVLHIKKPSAIGIFFPAEGCISESRAIRACLMIRVFNN